MCAVISLTQITDGDSIIASTVDGNFDTIASEINGSLADANIAAGGITLSTKATAEAWATYTPLWTAGTGTVTIGNGTLAGRYIKIGKTVHFIIYLKMGSTSATTGSLNWYFSLPIAANATVTGYKMIMGHIYVEKVSPVGGYIGHLRILTTDASKCDTCLIINGTWAPRTSSFGGTSPAAWAANDVMSISGTYETA